MGSTIKIAILAQATAAQKEFRDTADAAERAGRQTEQAFNGVGDKARQEFAQIGDQAQKAGREIESELGQAAQQAGEEVASIGDKAQAGLGKLGDFAKQAGGTLLAGLGLNLGADIGDQLVGGIMGALSKADIRANLAAQLGLEGEDAARAGKIAGEVYASNFGDSLQDVSNAVALVYKDIGQGSDEWTKAITADVLTVSKVFEQDLGGTTRAVGQLLRTGLASDAQSALDVITRGFQLGADKAGDLLDTLNEYGTQFRKLGLDAQSATGLLVQGLQAGARDSDIVADALKEFSIRAIDFSKSTANAFTDLGLNWGEMNAKIAKGGPEAAAALDLTLDRLRAIPDPADRSRIAVQLFGTQAEDLGDALYALDPSNAVATLGQVEGAAKKVGDTVGGTPLQKLEAFKRSLQNWGTTQLGEVVGQLDNLLSKIPASVWDGIGNSVNSLKSALGALAGAWAQVAKDATGSANGQEVLLKTLQGVRAVIDLLVVGVDGLTVVYQTATSAVYALVAGYKLLKGDVEGAKDAWDKSTAAMDSATQAAIKQAEDVNKLKNNWVEGGEAIKKANQDSAAAAVLAAKQTGDAHDRGAQQAAAAYTAAGTSISGSQSKIGTDGKAAATAVSGAYGSAATSVSGNFTTMGAAGQKAATDASAAHKKASSDVGTYWKGLQAVVVSSFGGAAGWLVSAGVAIMQGLYNGAVSFWNNTVAPWLRSRAAEIANLKGPPDKDREILFPAGKYVMEGFQGGLLAGWQDVRVSLIDFTNQIASTIHDAFAQTVSTPNIIPGSLGSSQQQILGKLEIEVQPPVGSGDRMMDLVMNQIRYEVRAAGGNVQAVLGRKG